MSKYDVMIGGFARKTIEALPRDAVIALKKRLEELATAPAEMLPGRRPEFRTAVFGPGGGGMIIATVSDEHRVIIVDQVVWVS